MCGKGVWCDEGACDEGVSDGGVVAKGRVSKVWMTIQRVVLYDVCTAALSSCT